MNGRPPSPGPGPGPGPGPTGSPEGAAGDVEANERGEGETASPELARTLVLNALRDLGDDGGIVADDDSRELLADHYEAAVDEERRERFAETLANLEGNPDEEAAAFLTDVADDVRTALVDAGVEVTLRHVVGFDVDPRDAALHNFMRSHDPESLEDLSLSAAARERVERGAASLDDDPEAAFEAFDAAIDAAGGGDGAVATRTLAGYASHRAGEDERAIDYVEEALHLETRAWPPKLVGYAADHRYPEKFRRGKLAAQAYFRWTTGIPEVGDVSVAYGAAGGESTYLPGRDECMPIDRLYPNGEFEIRLRGRLDELPVLQAYYVALGVVDREVDEARSADNVLFSGPESAGATETLKFREVED